MVSYGSNFDIGKLCTILVSSLKEGEELTLASAPQHATGA